MAGPLVEGLDVTAQVAEGRLEGGLTGVGVADLLKEPGIADRAPSDHQAGGAGRLQGFLGQADGEDVAIGEDGDVEAADGVADPVEVDRCPVHLPDGPPVDGEGVEAMTSE